MLELTSEEHDRFSEAKRTVLCVSRMEDGFRRLLYAYQDFEQYFLDASLRYLLFGDVGYEDVQEERLRANVRALGVLSSISALHDNFPVFPDGKHPKSIFRQFKNEWKKARDESVYFNFAWLLRNYALHQHEAVTVISIGNSWDEPHEVCETSVNAFVRLADVIQAGATRIGEKDDDFGQRAIQEFTDQCDLKLLFRRTMAEIGVIHNALRVEVEPFFRAKEVIYLEALERIKSIHPDSSVGYLIEESSSGSTSQDFFPDLIERTRRLFASRALENYHAHIVSSRVAGHR